ncbi:hypothetical protein XELAEV_18033695mg [Xenopus laevis]|uniref:Uncharacterized protein n=1 Tax=Xenopus laevis TaxID=8355 RepID=A0A974CJT4_XENLA|nr:hypothetical protein XELAEV_18033695mg [Xenopus laevis]
MIIILGKFTRSDNKLVTENVKRHVILFFGWLSLGKMQHYPFKDKGKTEKDSTFFCKEYFFPPSWDYRAAFLLVPRRLISGVKTDRSPNACEYSAIRTDPSSS